MRPLARVAAAPTGWRRRNGPMTLAQRLGRWPDLIPFHHSIRVTVNLVAPGTVRGTAKPLDEDFYALAASVAIQDDAASFSPEQEGFNGETHLSPMALWAHTDVWEEGGGRRLSNMPVSIGSIWGRGDRPFIYPAPFILPAGRILNLDLDNQTSQGSPNTALHFVWHGFKRPASTPPLPGDVLLEPRLLDALRGYADRGQLGRIEPFFYSMFLGHDRLSAQADYLPGLTESPTVTIADADFLAVYLMADFYDSTGTAYVTDSDGFPPEHLIRLLVNEGRRRLDDRPIAIEGITGHGKRWSKLPYPLTLKRGQTLTAIVTPQKRQTTADNRWIGHITIAGVRVLRGGR